MEFDELKKAWGQFNDKINCQEVVERQQVEEMLAKKRMTSYNRLLWYERISLGILFFLFLNVLVYILIDPFFLAMSNIVFFIAISVPFGINLFQYYKLKQAGCMKYDLERQILHVLQYKSSLYWDTSVLMLRLFRSLPGPSFMLLLYGDVLLWVLCCCWSFLISLYSGIYIGKWDNSLKRIKN